MRSSGGVVSFKKLSKNGSTPKLFKAEPKNTGLSLPRVTASLLKEYPTYNRRTLTKVLTDNHITIRGGRKKKTFSDEQVEEIKKMIKEGAFLKEIAAYFNIDTETFIFLPL